MTNPSVRPHRCAPVLTLVALSMLSCSVSGAEGDWPRWRGPATTAWHGATRPSGGATPKRIAWKAPVPGRGFSSPVVWGDRVFLTTAVPTRRCGRFAQPARRAPVPRPVLRPAVRQAALGTRGAGRDAASDLPFAVRQLRVELPDHGRPSRVRLLRIARSVCLHAGRHARVGEGLPPLRMYNNFGEGAWTALDGDRLVVVLDHEGESFLLALDKSTGRELWRTPRQGNTNWSGPYITTHNGRKQVIVSASREVVGYDLETRGHGSGSATGLGQNTIPAPVSDRWSGGRDERVPQPEPDRYPAGAHRGSHRHRCHRLAEPARQLVHAVAGPARRQAVHADRLRHAVVLRREDGQAVLPAAAAAEAVQLQGLTGWRERQAVSRLGER